MIRIKECASAGGVLRYFLDSLVLDDGSELRIVKEPGLWMGALAARLGLKGAVGRDSFASLLANIHPATGGSLTPRTKENRRAGYEVEISAPKSLSAMYFLTNDSALLAAFASSVKELVKHVEERAATRVRRDGADEDRVTKEVACAGFLHRTARPVGGIADPQIHAHLIVMNATWDAVEARVKALQFGDAYSLAPLLEAQFMSSLAEKVEALGYGITRKGRFWEIEDVPQSVLDKFSRRKEQIESVARAEGISDAWVLDGLGSKTRERKGPEPSLGDLKAHWASRLTSGEHAALHAVRDTAEGRRTAADEQSRSRLSGSGAQIAGETFRVAPLSVADRHKVSEAVRMAAGALFERQAVVPEAKLLDVGLRASPGKVKLIHVREEIEAQGIITRVLSGRAMVTTREAVAEEERLVRVAVTGKGRFVETASTEARHYKGLSEEQANAVRTVLESPDLVTVIQGRAGVGKTRLTAQAVQEVSERLNRPVCMLAPTAQAARKVLRSEGHKHADTVAKFLLDEDRQGRFRNGLIWVDEAGLLSMKDANKLLEVAARIGARVVLAGDDKQHRSVARGDILWTLQTQAEVRSASVEGVKRQRGAYKEVVESLNRGNVREAIAGLDSMNALRQLPKQDLFRAVARDYATAHLRGEKVALVAPTHAESREVTHPIRDLLKEAGKLKGSHSYQSLSSRGLTQFERGEESSYRPGDVVCFHAKVGSPARGHFETHSRWTVLGQDPFGNVLVTQGGLSVPQALPMKKAAAWDVFETRQIELSVGDTVRFTNSARLESRLDKALNLGRPEGRQLSHAVDRGAVHTVSRISRNGRLTLDNGLLVPPQFGHLTHGYCQTSFAAQGTTSDLALVLHSSMSGPAASFQQFYVGVTRGKSAVRVYTDSREELVSAISREDPRTTAMSLLQDGVEMKADAKLQRDASRRQQEAQERVRRAEEHKVVQAQRRERGWSL